MTTPARRFVFAPLERRGLLLGLTPVQLASLAGGLLSALLVVHLRANGAGILAGLAVAATGAAGACLPVRGRPPVAWLPVVLGWCRRRARGPVFDDLPPLGRWRGATRQARAIGGDLVIHTVTQAPGQEAMAVVRDRRTGTWAAVLPVRGKAFALLDTADKERRLAAWGSVLSGMARTGTPIHRVQWVERSFAGDGDTLARHLADAGAPTGAETAPGSVEQMARDGYAELIATAGPATVEHETLVVLAVHPRRASRSLRSFGRGPEGICGLLRREARLLQGQLRAADLSAGEPLDRDGLTMALRSAAEPRARRARTPGGVGLSTAWPLASDEAWSTLRVDASWCATYWIAEWPRVEVGPDFLAPLLLAGDCRTVSVTMAPVAPDRARRLVEAARTADAADEELRRRAGFLPTARRRREAEGVAQRESELADGHAEYRFSGYVTVFGEERGALETACAEVEQAAQQARVEVRRLYGQQREAFTWTLPLGRGLS